MTRDEKVYEDPEIFRPERFETSGTKDPREIVFGFGRRSAAPPEFISGYPLTSQFSQNMSWKELC